MPTDPSKNADLLRKKLFSLPFNSRLSKKEVQTRYLPFLKEFGEYIYDIYFSVSIPPFEDDAMGQGRVNRDRNEDIVKFLLGVQRQFGITISATFNNIMVSPEQANLDLFIEHFTPLYERGVRSVTIPHIHWMLSGALKRAFPELTVKNTVLRKVNTPQEYVDNCEAGFDVVNIDRANIRDRDNLKRLKRAYDRYKKPMVILVNEGCRGQCPAMDEHYTVNCTIGDDRPYFKHEISEHTCPMWQRIDPAYQLRVANMPLWREDFEEILEYVQLLKLHGRSELRLLFESMGIVRDYARGHPTIGDPTRIRPDRYDPHTLDVWRKHTKNCKFECWDCRVCDELAATSTEMVF